MFEVAAIDHVVLTTSKPTAMIHFYSQILGCKIERQVSQGIKLVQLRAGSALIDLVILEQQSAATDADVVRNMDHFCLQLKSISEPDIKAHLVKHNITITDFASRYGAQGFGGSVYIKDPEGNTIELKSQI
jgi:glyoxylase I family protein